MKPVLQALVLADRIYTDRSGKKIIAGTFDCVIIGTLKPREVQLPDGTKLPMLPGGTDAGCPSLYISLTDVVNGTGITVQFVNAAKNESLIHLDFSIKSESRLETHEIVLPLPKLSMLVR